MNLIDRITYLWMRFKSKSPSLFNYANIFWVILVAIVYYLKEQKLEGNLPDGWHGIVDHAYIVIGIIGVILLKLPTKDPVLQSDKPIEQKIAIKKSQNKQKKAYDAATSENIRPKE